MFGPRFAIYTPVIQLADGAPALDAARRACARTRTRSTGCAGSRSRTYDDWRTTRRGAPLRVFVDGEERAVAADGTFDGTRRGRSPCTRVRSARGSTPGDALPFSDRRLAMSAPARLGRDARLQRGRDPRDVGEERRRRTARAAASRSRCSSSRTARPTARSTIARRTRGRVPRGPGRAPRRSRLRPRAARRAARRDRRRGRQLRHRLLRSRLPRRGGRRRCSRRTVPRSSSARSAARARPTTRDPAPQARDDRCSARSCASCSGCGVSDTHGMKAMRRAAVEPYARICIFGQDLFDTELILRVERAGLRTGGDPGRGARAAPGAQLVPLARPAYAARPVQTPVGAVEGIPGTADARVRPHRQRRGRAVGEPGVGHDRRRPDRRDRAGRRRPAPSISATRCSRPDSSTCR